MVDHIMPGCRKTIPAATVDILSFAKWLEQFLAIPKPENNPAIQYWIMILTIRACNLRVGYTSLDKAMWAKIILKNRWLNTKHMGQFPPQDSYACDTTIFSHVLQYKVGFHHVYDFQ